MTFPLLRSLGNLVDDTLNQTVIFGYDRIGYYLRKPLWNPEEVNSNMKGKVCLITGANSGLGKATALHLAKLGAEVHLVCRNEQLGKKAQEEIQSVTDNSKIHLHLVDMSVQQQVEQFASRFKAEQLKLDVLVNNAGLLINQRETNEIGIEMSFAVNVLGYFLLTNLLLPLLQQSAPSRIINVSSGGMYTTGLNVTDAQFEKRKYDGVQAYAEHKRAEVIFTEIWAKQLQDSGVTVNAMHPGWADTKGVQRSLPTFRKMTQAILRDAAQGADTIIWLATNPNLTQKDSGKFWFDRKARTTYRSKKTKNTPSEIQQYWESCCELTNHLEWKSYLSSP